VTTYAGDKVKDFSKSMFVRDIPSYDDAGNRLWIDSTVRTNVRNTSETFTGLAVDNNYVASYFPDVYVQDEGLNRRVKVPASIAAVGAISYNDRVSYPWFAPAGFNRAALDFVNNTSVRLNQSDRDTLYDSRINPIATFPQGGFVIFGQKTLQLATTALNRVNVRRLLLEVKRVVGSIANSLLFEQNNAATRARFVAGVSPQLALIQAQAGIERFRVVCDATNNTDADVEANRMNGRIVIVPTKTVEFIAIDFVITPAGVQFP
jgi:phage tail sheath protein FI